MKNPRVASLFLNSFVSLILASSLIATRVQADALDNWSTSVIGTNSMSMGALTYGNGLFVATAVRRPMGEFGEIFSSTDGLSWTQRTTYAPPSIMTPALVDSAFGNGTFVAVGWAGVGYSSTNGIDWQNTLGTGLWNLNGVTYGNGKFVAVGDVNGSVGGSNIFTSPDGFTWTPRRSAPASGAASIYSVVFDGSRFKAVGDGGYLYTSTDAVTWTRQIVSGKNLRSIACAGTMIVIADGYGSTNVIVPASFDLSAPYPGWKTLDTGTGVQVSSLTYLSGMFIGSGQDLDLNQSSIIFSRDGTNWSKANFHSPDKIGKIAFTGSRFAGIGSVNIGTLDQPNYRSTFYISDPVIGMGIQPGSAPGINLSGLVGRSYQIQCLNGAPTNGSNSWQVLTNFTLPSSPYTWTDVSATNLPQRFYRAVLLP
jgi:hypothetical protein